MPRKDISVRTADGSAPAGLFTPAGAVPVSGVILYMDAFGPRPALDEMAERLAGNGYTVLVPDETLRSRREGMRMRSSICRTCLHTPTPDSCPRGGKELPGGASGV